MTTEELISNYANALAEVEALGATFEDAMKRRDKDFSKEYFCWMFESLLQYSLLEMTWVDGVINPNEVLLANKVTKYGDVVSLGNSLLKTNVKWTDLLEMSANDMKNWLASFKNALNPMKNIFVGQFAAFDDIAPGDSLNKLVEGVTSLLVLFCTVDGKADEREKEAAKNSLIISTLIDIGRLINK